MSSLVTWVETITAECATAETSLSDASLASATELKGKALSAREAAKVSAGALFDDEPLHGVSCDSWRRLWRAARDYSVAEAYPGQAFPVLPTDGLEYRKSTRLH